MMKKLTKIIAMTALAALLLMMLGGCSSEQEDKTKPAELITPDVIELPAGSSAEEPAAEPAKENGTRRQDGERFEGVIMLEGMEETVRYEHVRNDAVGFEMDYDYENFARQNETVLERFVSQYDNPAAPQNYMEVIFQAQDAETVADSVGNELSQKYDIIRESCVLERAGSCIRIDASAAKDGHMPDLLEAVYIIPSGNGCLVAAAHYSFESAEGIGRRFASMLNTLTVLSRAE